MDIRHHFIVERFFCVHSSAHSLGGLGRGRNPAGSVFPVFQPAQSALFAFESAGADHFHQNGASKLKNSSL